LSRNQSIALRGGDPVFILTISGFAGDTWNLASRPVTVTGAPEGDRLYRGGLTVAPFSEQIEKSKGSPDANGIAIQVDMGVDLAQLRKRGHDLSHATASLDMVTIPRGDTSTRTPIAQQDWADRFRLFTGRPVSREICPVGLPKTLAAFTLQAEAINDAARLVDPEARVTATSWPSAPDSSLGSMYPTVFGAPGAYLNAAGSTKTTSGSPALIVEESSGNAQKLLLSDGHVVSTSVLIFDSTTSETFNVVNGEDGNGRPCAYVNVSGAATISLTESSYYVGWNTAGGDGGVRNPYGSGVLTEAGHVALHALSRSTNGVDYAAWHAAASAMTLPLSGYWRDPNVSPTAWVVANIGKHLPVEVHGGPDGMRPLFYDPTTPISLAPELVAGAEVVRISGISCRGTLADVSNRVTVRYAMRDNGSTFRRSITISPATSSASEHSTRIAEQSLQDYGVVADLNIDADLIYDDAAAEEVAASAIRVRALLRDTVTYRLPPYMAGYTIGTLVRLTDLSLYMTQSPALIVEREWTGDDWEITMELISEMAIAPYGSAA
jgi:hypothetical protein